MTRQVIRSRDTAVRAAGTPGTQDEYLDRLLKLIPGEMGSVILGLFTFLAPQFYKGVPPS